MELPVVGRPWRASMASNPLSKAATGPGTPPSVMARKVTMARSRRGQEGGAPALVGRDVLLVAQGQADVVPPVEQPLARELVEREGAGRHRSRRLNECP